MKTAHFSPPRYLLDKKNADPYLRELRKLLFSPFLDTGYLLAKKKNADPYIRELRKLYFFPLLDIYWPKKMQIRI
jgi:hypothetical protein